MAARMPSVGAQIRGSERCQERRRRLLEPIAEEPTGTTDETTPSDDSNDGQNNDDIDPFICTPCEDSEPARRAADIYQPTAAEYEAHRHDHYPYRNWCPFCVKARATGQRHGHACPHRRIPVIGIDYCFLTSDGRVLRKDELAGLDEATRQSLAKILLIREHSPNGQTGCIFAHVVPQKGVDEDMFSVTKVSEDVKWMGHTHIILKGDNEPALKKLIAESLKTLRVTMDQATDEKSVEYDPQSNGGTEIGVRNFKDQFRTLKLCLEDRLGKAIPVDHPATAWLVEHANSVLNTRSRGTDGLSPWARVRGRPMSLKTYCFGEKVMYKLATSGPDAEDRGNVSARFDDGLFLGYNKDSYEYVVGTATGIAFTRSLQRVPPDSRWSPDLVAGIRATPWSLHQRPETEATLPEGNTTTIDPVGDRPPPMPRNFKISTKKLRDVWGFTMGCPQCDWTREHGERRDGIGHSKACRERIMEVLGRTEAGRKQLEATEERVDRALAERVRFDDEANSTNHAAGRVRSGERWRAPPDEGCRA